MPITDPEVKARAISLMREQGEPLRNHGYVHFSDHVRRIASKFCAGGAVGIAAGLTTPDDFQSIKICEASGLLHTELAELIEANDNHSLEYILSYMKINL